MNGDKKKEMFDEELKDILTSEVFTGNDNISVEELLVSIPKDKIATEMEALAEKYVRDTDLTNVLGLMIEVKKDSMECNVFMSVGTILTKCMDKLGRQGVRQLFQGIYEDITKRKER